FPFQPAGGFPLVVDLERCLLMLSNTEQFGAT
ncbi:uncharacterized, partial [Tachysurus ichikawai]